MAKFCRYCGSPINEGARFCPECGKKLAEDPKPLKPEKPAARPAVKQAAQPAAKQAEKPPVQPVRQTSPKTAAQTARPAAQAARPAVQTAKQAVQTANPFALPGEIALDMPELSAAASAAKSGGMPGFVKFLIAIALGGISIPLLSNLESPLSFFAGAGVSVLLIIVSLIIKKGRGGGR